MMENAPSFITYEKQKEFWIKWKEDFFAFLGSKESEYMLLEKHYKKEILEEAPRLTMEEASFSERSKEIISRLEENEEYMSLQREYKRSQSYLEDLDQIFDTVLKVDFSVMEDDGEKD